MEIDRAGSSLDENGSLNFLRSLREGDVIVISGTRYVFVELQNGTAIVQPEVIHKAIKKAEEKKARRQSPPFWSITWRKP